MFRRLHILATDQSGITALEYAVLAGVVVAALLLGAATLSSSNGAYANVFQVLEAKVTSAKNSKA
jgi:pilus assembly protein Flp/PilA